MRLVSADTPGGEVGKDLAARAAIIWRGEVVLGGEAERVEHVVEATAHRWVGDAEHVLDVSITPRQRRKVSTNSIGCR